jgi:hypothetical protein
MPEDLQRTDPIGMDLKDMEPTLSSSVPAILTIGVPPGMGVRRNAMTGQLEIGGGEGDNLTVLDLIGLRDSIDHQIVELQKQAQEQEYKIANSWEPL